MLEFYHKLLESHSVVIEQPSSLELEGIGKTRLALEFVYKYGYAFQHGIFWVNAAENWKKGFLKAILNANLPFYSSQDTKEEVLYKFQEYLKSHPYALIIMDDIQDVSELEEEIVPGFSLLKMESYLLCTSLDAKSHPQFLSIPIAISSEESSHQLLIESHKPENSLDEEAVKKLCKLSRYFPLTIQIIKTYLREKPQTTYKNYLQSLSTILKKQKASQQNHGPEVVLKAVLKKQCELIPEDYQKSLLETAGQFEKSYDLSYTTLGLLAGLDPDGELLPKAFQELEKLSLVSNLPEQKILLNPAVRKFLEDQLQEESPNIIKNYKPKAAQRLFNAYKEFTRLEKEYRKRGIEGIITDLEFAAKWSNGNKDILEYRDCILEEENNLSRKIAPFHFVIQQIYSRMKGKNSLDRSTLSTLESSLVRVPWRKGAVWLKRYNQCVHENFDPEENLITAHFSHCGTKLVTVSENAIRTWETGTGKLSQTFLEGFTGARCIQFSSNNKYILSNKVTSLELRAANTQKKILQISAHSDWITTVCFSFDNRMFLSGEKMEL